MKALWLLVGLLSLSFMMASADATGWWDDSYAYRYPIISLGRTANQPILVNGTVWTQNATSMYLYCNVPGCTDGIKAVANTTAQLNWENDTSFTGHNIAQVWGSNAVSIWHMNGNGSVTDSSGTNMTLLPSGNSIVSVTGITGNAVKLGGTDDFYTVTDTGQYNFTDKNFTVSAWINTTTGSSQCIVCKENAMGTVTTFRLMIWETGKASFQLMNSSNVWANIMLSNNTVNNGNWHQVVGVVAGQTLALYVDGIYNNLSTFLGPVGYNPQPLTVGMSNYGPYSYDFIGTVDEIKIYNRSLTATEIQDDYYSGIHNATTNLTTLGTLETINITNCTGGGTPILTFNIFDETNQTSMNGSLDITFDVSDTDKNYFFNFASNHTHYICVGSEVSMTVDAIVQYREPGYPDRNYFLDNAELNGSSSSTINLYLLATANGQATTIKVQNSIGMALEGVIVKFQRLYIGENVYRTVAMTKSDYLGYGSAFLQPTMIWYKYILSQNGAVLATKGPSILITTTLTLDTGASDIYTYIDRTGGITSLCTYQNATKYIVCTVDIATGLPQEFCLDVDKYGVVIPEDYNTTCLTTASGTLMVNVTTLADTNKSAVYTLSVFSADGTEDILIQGQKDFVTGMLYGLTGVLLAAIMFMTLSGIGSWNPAVGITMGIVSLIASVALGALEMTLAALGSIIMIGIILIYKVKS